MGKFLVYGIVFCAFVMGGTVYWTLQSHPKISQAITGQMKTEFMSYATQIQSGLRLQVAELHQVEVFERTSTLSMFWNQIKLPDLVVSITTPVTFTYFVDLNQPWDFEIIEKKVIAHVPKLEFNPPAPDLSSTRFEVKKGSVFRNQVAAMKALQSEITQLLETRAQGNANLAKEAARKQIGQFVMTWLQSRFPKDKDLSVTVVFADEAPASAALPAGQ